MQGSGSNKDLLLEGKSDSDKLLKKSRAKRQQSLHEDNDDKKGIKVKKNPKFGGEA